MSKKSKPKHIKKLMVIAVVLLFAFMFYPSNVVQAADDDGDGLDNLIEDWLLRRYSPILHFTSGENFYPVDANHSIAISELWHWSGVLKVQDPDPTEGTLTGPSSDHFLKNKLGSYENIRDNYKANEALLGYKVYGHVRDYSGYRFVQYWFFYIYNDGSVNQHEGDWEMIQIKLDTSTNTPISAQYSQHHSGESAVWGDVEKTGEQPHVYMARGSHANYFRSYQGKVGFENDEVAADGKVLSNTTYTLENLGEQGIPLNGNVWINWEGRWGNWEYLPDAEIGFAGPRSPGWGENQEKYSDPATWASSLFIVDSLWFALCWFMYYLLYIILVIIGLLILRKIYKIYKVKKEGGLMVGKVVKTRAGVGIAIGFVAIGLTVYALFVPWYSVLADIASPTVTTAGEVFLIDGIDGVQVNFLVTGTGMTPLFSLGIPFSLIVGAGIVFNMLDIIGVKDPKKLGNGYLKSGVFFIIFLGLLLLLMTQFEAIMYAFAQGMTLPPEAIEVAQAISQSPFAGAVTKTFYSGTVSITFIWGFAIGGMLLLAAAIIKILAGLIVRSAPSDFA
ncbi:MAG: hypothetical protein HWN66_11695 [Candidatus Helarchaeota archaeon]|nr:hypothetical protein [Candidatus Helarchaeota archaeon]